VTLPDLRAYQTDVIERAAPLAPAGVLVQLPTGSGKTRIGQEIALRHLARGGRRVLWLAHRDELVEQPASKLRAMGTPVATVRPGAAPVGDAPVVIASVQTLVARGPSAAPPATLVIYDEARHVGDAPRWSEVARAVGEGRPRVGLDATPQGDLRGLFAAIVQGPSVRALIDEGHLVQPVHLAPSTMVDQLAAHPVDAWERLLAPDRALVFCRDVAHARATAREANERGARAAAVHGETPTRERRAAIEAYARGEIELLVGVNVFVDGFDAPATRAIIVARGVSNESTWVQIGGRGLRTAPGKTSCKIVDLLGLTHRFGLLDEPREWSIDGRPARRTSALPSVTRCPSCLAWGPPSSRCVGCGRETPPAPPPKVRARDLQEVRQREPKGQQFERLVEYVRLARRRAYQDGWAAFRWKGTYGYMPPAGWLKAAIKAAGEAA
jgi:superfamily II DNA or RNA helicase